MFTDNPLSATKDDAEIELGIINEPEEELHEVVSSFMPPENLTVWHILKSSAALVVAKKIT